MGSRVGYQAWMTSGRIVSAAGQLLVWLLTALGRLLRPVAARVVTKLYGKPAAGPATAPLPRWVHGWRRLTAAWAYPPVTGAVLTVAALVELRLRGVDPVGLAGGFAAAATAPLIWRRELLRPVAAIVLGALAAGLLSGQHVLLTTAFAGLYTLFLLAGHLPRQASGLLGAAGVATVVVIYLASTGLDPVPWPASLVAVVAAVGLGDARRTVQTTERRARRKTTETLTLLGEARHEHVVLKERARIARELHDVVAHSVSMIAVQAETAPYTMAGLSPEARAGFTEIAGTARDALTEMRRLLAVLRADASAEADVTPQPRLDRLPDLIRQHEGAGGHVDLSVRGEQRTLSATVELSAYRIVQEALTNARRHAPGARVHVELRYAGDRLDVRVSDTGPDAATIVGAPRAGGPAPSPHGDPGGHGLIGMRERATMLGGRFSAGRRTGGGFAVEAELPVWRKESTGHDPGADRR
jgi:signal transduction histidine kinase